MVRYLSDEWLAAAAGRLTAVEIDPPVTGPGLVVETAVTAVPDAPDDAVVAYRIVLTGRTAELVPGNSPAGTATPTVRFTQTYATAAAVADGRVSAQTAFMAGDIRIGGDVTSLIAHADLIDRIGDALGDLRRVTSFV